MSNNEINWSKIEQKISNTAMKHIPNSGHPAHDTVKHISDMTHSMIITALNEYHAQISHDQKQN